MFCKNCGKEVDGYTICPFCGADLSGDNQDATQNNVAPRTNGFAIAGFIASFFSWLIGLVLSIIGLVKVKEYNSGKGFAIAGIIICVIGLVLTIIAVCALAAYWPEIIKALEEGATIQ